VSLFSIARETFWEGSDGTLCSYAQYSQVWHAWRWETKTWWAAPGLLALAGLSPPSCRRRKRRPVRAPFWRGADAHVPGYRSRSVQARGPNSAASSTSGSLWAVSPCRWSGRRDGANLALVVLGRLSRPLVSGRSLTVVALVVTPQ